MDQQAIIQRAFAKLAAESRAIERDMRVREALQTLMAHSGGRILENGKENRELILRLRDNMLPGEELWIPT